MKKNFTLILFLIISIYTHCQEEVSIKNGPVELQGTLLATKKPSLLVVIIAGSGPTDRNGNSRGLPGENNSLKLLAEALYKNGISSIRYDKRGLNPAYPVPEAELVFDDMIHDAIAVGNAFKSDPRFTKIGYLGHSEGSLIGMLAARETKAAFFISVAGPGMPAGEVLKEQMSNLPPSVKNEAFTALDSLAGGQPLRGEIPGMEAVFRRSVQPYLISWFRHDPAEIIATLKGPVLIVQGTNDIQVSKTHADKLYVARKDASLVIIEEMNHVLKKAPADRLENMATYTDSELPLSRGLEKAIVKFLKKVE